MGRKVTQDQCSELDTKAKEVSKEAIAFAEASPEMPTEELFTDVYANPFGPYLKGALPNIITNENSGE